MAWDDEVLPTTWITVFLITPSHESVMDTEPEMHEHVSHMIMDWPNWFALSHTFCADFCVHGFLIHHPKYNFWKFWWIGNNCNRSSEYNNLKLVSALTPFLKSNERLVMMLKMAQCTWIKFLKSNWNSLLMTDEARSDKYIHKHVHVQKADHIPIFRWKFD